MESNMMLSTMNRQLGTKWFTFYTKVRPCIVYFSTFLVVLNFLIDPTIYTSNLLMMISFLGQIEHCILSFIVLALSCGENYENFVRFVKGVLLYEAIFTSFTIGIEQKNIAEFIFVGSIAFVFGYFVYYKQSMKYFTRRLQYIYY